jgi:tellurite resistance protein TerC
MRKFLDHCDWLLRLTLRQARRLVIAVIGGTVLLLGIVMFVTPGPGFLGVLAGVAILATEFAWARWLLHEIKRRAQQFTNRTAESVPQAPHSPVADHGKPQPCEAQDSGYHRPAGGS